jgi:hypothetical protein
MRRRRSGMRRRYRWRVRRRKCRRRHWHCTQSLHQARRQQHRRPNPRNSRATRGFSFSRREGCNRVSRRRLRSRFLTSGADFRLREPTSAADHRNRQPTSGADLRSKHQHTRMLHKHTHTHSHMLYEKYNVGEGSGLRFEVMAELGFHLLSRALSASLCIEQQHRCRCIIHTLSLFHSNQSRSNLSIIPHTPHVTLSLYSGLRPASVVSLF